MRTRLHNLGIDCLTVGLRRMLSCRTAYDRIGYAGERCEDGYEYRRSCQNMFPTVPACIFPRKHGSFLLGLPDYFYLLRRELSRHEIITFHKTNHKNFTLGLSYRKVSSLNAGSTEERTVGL